MKLGRCLNRLFTEAIFEEKKMRKVLLIVILFFVVMFVRGEKTVEFPDISRPDFIVAHNGKLVIMEKPHIYIYSLKDFKLLKKFGRQGEGPGEFQVEQYGAPMSISFPGNEMMVSSENKASYFSMDGQFLRQKKTPQGTVMYQVGDQFLGVGPTFDEAGKQLVSFRIMDGEFKLIKKVFETSISVNIGTQDMVLPYGAFTHNPVYKDKIILVTGDQEFQIEIFDHKGNFIRKIRKEPKKIRIPEAFKQKALQWFQTDPRFKPFYDSVLKNKIKFRSHFPAIRDINLGDDRIHVITYNRKDDLWECIILNFKGEELNRLFIPMAEYIPFSYYALLYSVENGKLYSLVEDPDEEVWTLHILNTKK